MELRQRFFAVIFAMLSAVAPTRGFVEPTPVYKDPSAPLEQRVEDLFARLTPTERLQLTGGSGIYTMQPVTRLGIPALELADGPNGVRSNYDQPATVFPTGVALAATWNIELLDAVGSAQGREAQAMRIAVLLGPNVNIQRTPLAGRNFETYSEDPFLTGKLGIAYVNGVQSQGVGTSVKHFVGNEQELERIRSNSIIDERTLREIYLLPFEMIVKEAKPWTAMAAYNRVNGAYMTENSRLVSDILKGEWAFDGVFMSDWGATHSSNAAKAGLDLEMPGPPQFLGASLAQMLENHQLEQSTLDASVRRILRLIIRSGALDTMPQANANAKSRGEVASDRNRRVALNAAQEAITLLKNDRDLLPLDVTKIKSLAVIGPNADALIIEGGGSANVIPARRVTPLEALRKYLGNRVKIKYAKGVDNDPIPPPADPRFLSPTPTRAEQGLHFEFYRNPNFEGAPAKSGVDDNFESANLAIDLFQMSARWEGFFWPPRDGTYEFSVSQIGQATITVDGHSIITPATPEHSLTDHPDVVTLPIRTGAVELKSGRSHPIKIEYVATTQPWHIFRFGLRIPGDTVEHAISAARQADAAIVFVGSSRSLDAEGADRKSMALGSRQDDLVRAVAAANPKTIVVLNNGAPVEMPWIDQVPAILEAWLPGEGGAEAVAQVLFGAVNPSGKLPVTFPRRLEDNPTFRTYGDRDAHYDEGIFVGYRHYERKNITPLFPFGHGLSYTKFSYANLRAPQTVNAGRSFNVSVDIKNVGTRAGRDTVQLYVSDLATRSVPRPIKELKGFQKVELSAGETKTIQFTLTPRDLAYYDVDTHAWMTAAGAYRVSIGDSSQDIREQQVFRYDDATIKH